MKAELNQLYRIDKPVDLEGPYGCWLVRLTPRGVEEIMEVRVAVVGNVDAGKSTTLGVLTRGGLDDGRGKASETSGGVYTDKLGTGCALPTSTRDRDRSYQLGRGRGKLRSEITLTGRSSAFHPQDSLSFLPPMLLIRQIRTAIP